MPEPDVLLKPLEVEMTVKRPLPALINDHHIVEEAADELPASEPCIMEEMLVTANVNNVDVDLPESEIEREVTSYLKE